MAIVAAIAVALGTALLPGFGGARAMHAIAACAFALFLVAVYRNLCEGEAAHASFASALQSPDGPGTAKCAAAVIACAIAGLVATFAFGSAFDSMTVNGIVDEARDAVARCYIAGIGGFLAGTAALVAWAKAGKRALSRWRERKALASGEVIALFDTRFVLATAACALVAALGLGLCFGMRYAPFSETPAYALAAGLASGIVLACLSLWLAHVPALANQLNDLHDQLEDTAATSAANKRALERMTTKYNRLYTMHRNEQESRKQLAEELEKLLEGQNALPPAAIDEACQAIAERNKLSNREARVLACLARGWSRKRTANELHIEPSTVNSHVTRIYRKLDVHSAQELIDYVGKLQRSLPAEGGAAEEVGESHE